MSLRERPESEIRECIAKRPERVSFIYDELQFYPKEELIDLLIQTANELDALKKEVKNNG